MTPVPQMWNRQPLTLAALMAWTREDPSGCIIWTRYLNHDGYGRAMCEGTRWMIHRLVWALVNGPIPDGYEVDHLCFTRACVNVDHLQLLTVNENRARSRAALSATCTNGHLLAGDNLRIVTLRNGKRVRRCRACEHINTQRAVARNLRATSVPDRPSRTHCKRGHEFTPENTYTQPSRPWVHTCRECKRLRR